MDRKTRTKNFYNKINLEYFTKIKNFIHREEVWLSEYGGMSDCLLSNYENITLDIIKKNKDIPWNFNLISDNNELSLEVIEYFSNLKHLFVCKL